MNLQSLSTARDALDILDERSYDLKEAFLHKAGDTSKLKRKYRYAATEVILALNESITERNIEEEEIKREVYQKRLLEIICKVYEVDEKELLMSSGTRKPIFKEPRQMHMVLLHKTFKFSLSKAAGIYGQDHATCSHSCKTIRNLYQTEKMFRDRNWPIIEHCMSYDRLIKENRTIDYLTEKK